MQLPFLRRSRQSAGRDQEPLAVSSPAPEAKMGRAQLRAALEGAPVSWSERGVSDLARIGFTQNPIVFRCVKILCEAGSAIRFSLIAEGMDCTDHPLLSLLAHPNDTQDRESFLETVIGHLMLTGNSYIEVATHPETGDPLCLYALRPDRMHVLPDAQGWPAGYEYRIGGRKRVFTAGTAAQVLHLKSFHPTNDHYGLSPLQAASTAMDVHASATKWSRALLDNAARPSGAIVYSGAEGQAMLSPEQYARLVEEIEINHQGARNAGRPMFLEGGLDWKPMGFSPSDMEFLKTKENAGREIATAFGVPPMLLGLPGDNTYANYQEANRAFYRLTVLPLVTKLTSALSQWLSEHYGTPLTLKPDFDSVTALASEREAQWTRIASADFLTDQEKRSLLGFAPLAYAEGSAEAKP